VEYSATNDAKTIRKVYHDRPFFPGDASLEEIMPDMKQTKGKEYLSISNVSARPKRKNALLSLINASPRVFLQVSNASIYLCSQ